MKKRRTPKKKDDRRSVTVDYALPFSLRRRPTADEIAERNAIETRRKIRAIFAEAI